MKTKKLALIALALCFALILTGCPPKKQFDNFPHEIGSIWRTKNGELEFTIREDSRMVGTMKTDAEEIEVFYVMSPNGSIEVYPIEILAKAEEEGGLWLKDAVEQWGADYYSKDAFGVTVHESTYFIKGQKFVFHRENDGEASEN